MPFGRLSELATEVSAIRAKARPGPEARGLDRLAALIAACQSGDDLTLVFEGD